MSQLMTTLMKKDMFYLSLQTELANAPNQDLITFMGDTNAKVGADKIHNDRTISHTKWIDFWISAV